MMRTIALAALLLGAAPTFAALPTKPVLSLAAAWQVVAAAAAEAERRHSTVVIVVVDDGGYPIVLERLDDTQVASVEVGIGKARTAAIFRRPSRDFEEQIRNGRAAKPGAAGRNAAAGRPAVARRRPGGRRHRGQRQHAAGRRGHRPRGRGGVRAVRSRWRSAISRQPHTES
ncbi:MAG TPA: heme-binding protein [Candidatus Dormibacteraeota bacterium]|nr:heme-binding protein [Candidatus Dormibacteraeota bacterium]